MSSPPREEAAAQVPGAALQELWRTIADLQGRVQALQTGAPTVPAIAEALQATALPKRKPLRDPPLYDGVPASFTAWRCAMEYKLRRDADFIGDHRDQYEYLWAGLETSVQKVVRSYYEVGGRDGAYRYTDFLDYLERIYDDPHKRAQALAELETLKMKPGQSFAQFIAIFERTLATAGGLAWADEVRTNFLRFRVSPRIREACVGRGMGDGTYLGAVAIYRQVAQDLEAIELDRRFGPHRAGAATAPRPPKDEDTPMTGVAAMGSRPNGGARGRRRPGQTQPSDTNRRDTRPRAQWVPSDEYQRRRETGACLRCGNSGHQVADCTYAAALRPSTVVAAITTETPGEGNE
ncbi:hypothetical protein PoMZ_11087 [Pyricularia oryzae]|uniref:CCHC-type domain-containing protein n=1 Tax=Pyricularia oryzae TaxID=318829 RepID=A0A4P7NJP3_PYROR|nr:hypothetical protein PoMZ_11087 [Pyricularia oryzae]